MTINGSTRASSNVRSPRWTVSNAVTTMQKTMMKRCRARNRIPQVKFHKADFLKLSPGADVIVCLSPNFVIFQRLHGRDAYAGTGIGLALCKKIVEHHGGTIWIDTDYPDGTRFRFTMPQQTTVVEPTAAATLEGTHQ